MSVADGSSVRSGSGPVAADFSAAAVCSSEAMVFSGFLIFFTLRQPRNAKARRSAPSRTKTMVNAAQRGSQMARISPTMNQKKNNENAPMTPATAKKAPPVAPVLTVCGDLQLGQLDLGADQRGHVRRDVLDQLAHRGVAVDGRLGDERDGRAG